MGKVPVFFDRNYKTPHYQLQAIPIPSKLAAIAKDLFMVIFHNTNNIVLNE